MAITRVKKSKLGRQDLLFDIAGTGTSSSVPTSNGLNRSIDNLNASHLPSTSATRAKDRADASASTATDVDGHLQELYDDTNSIGVPDDITLENDAGTLQIKDLGVSTAKLGAASVTNAKMADNSVDSDQYVDGSIDLEHLNQTPGSEAVDTAAIRDDAVTEAKIADGAVTTDKAGTGVNGFKNASLNMDGSGNGFSGFIALSGRLTGIASQDTSHAVSGVTGTDILLATLNTDDSTLALEAAVPGTDNIDIRLNGAPGGTAVVSYAILRAPAV